jgi:hypothetical protein
VGRRPHRLLCLRVVSGAGQVVPILSLDQCARIRISTTGRLGLRLRLNQSVGANQRGGSGPDHPRRGPAHCASSEIAVFRRRSVQAVLEKAPTEVRAAWRRTSGSGKDRSSSSSSCTPLTRDVSDGCDHSNRLVRRDIQSMGRMSARLDRVRPLLCGGAFMALRVARRRGARSVGPRR